jgi:hypothetical protein
MPFRVAEVDLFDGMTFARPEDSNAAIAVESEQDDEEYAAELAELFPAAPEAAAD